MQNPGQSEQLLSGKLWHPSFCLPRVAEKQLPNHCNLANQECLVYFAHSFLQPTWHKVTISQKLSLTTNFQLGCCHPPGELGFVVLLNCSRRLQTSENHSLNHSPHSDTHYCIGCIVQKKESYYDMLRMRVMISHLISRATPTPLLECALFSSFSSLSFSALNSRAAHNPILTEQRDASAAWWRSCRSTSSLFSGLTVKLDNIDAMCEL
jgi:hypothetical protein